MPEGLRADWKLASVGILCFVASQGQENQEAEHSDRLLGSSWSEDDSVVDAETITKGRARSSRVKALLVGAEANFLFFYVIQCSLYNKLIGRKWTPRQALFKIKLYKEFKMKKLRQSWEEENGARQNVRGKGMEKGGFQRSFSSLKEAGQTRQAPRVRQTWGVT